MEESLPSEVEFFRELPKKRLDSFYSKERTFDTVKFSGIIMNEVESGFLLCQADYYEKLQFLNTRYSLRDFRSLGAKLAWIGHQRQDICCAVAFASQITQNTLNAKSIKDINKILKHLLKTREFQLRYRPREEAALKLSGYADAYFENNAYFSSQLGMVIYLSDGKERCNVIHYGSHKDKLVTTAILAGETYAFGTASDFLYLF